MINTGTTAEVVAAQVYDRAYWEKQGVRFKQTETIGISISGATSKPFLTWSAYYKEKYLAGGGGTSVDSLAQWMGKKHKMIAERMRSILLTNPKRKS